MTSWPGRSSLRALRARVLPDDSRAGRAYIDLRFRLWFALTRQRSKAIAHARAEYQAALAVYSEFQRTFEPSQAAMARQAREACARSSRPAFSVVTAVFDPPLEQFRETVRSLTAQTYPAWTWHVADASPGRRIWRYLSACASRDPRIRPIRLASNAGIAANTNEALRASTGDFVVMLDHDDTVAPFALCSMADAIHAHPEADVLYSDSDKLDERGRRCEPFFKPDYSPELLLCCNYLDQLCVLRRALLDRVGLLNPDFDGAQDWDLYLRIAEHTANFVHVPQVLYHWRKTPRSTAQSLANKPRARHAQKLSVAAHLSRRGLMNARVEFLPDHPIHRFHPVVSWTPAGRTVSIIIPTRDHAGMLSTCLDGVLRRTDWPRLQVILADTGSVEAATTELYAALVRDPRVRIVSCPGPFNFSAVCNAAVRQAEGELILLLNNDVEILHAEWLERMAQWLDLDGVGVVGATLLFPDRRIQHGGVVIGFGGLASNLFMNGPEHVTSPFGPEGWYRNVSAVSGACLLTTRSLYDRLSGLDERFVLNYSDVDFCLRAGAAGYRVVLASDARLVHHESVTHGRRIPRSDFLRAIENFRPLLERGDPFFNPNLSCHSCHPTLRRDRRDNPVDATGDLLRRLPEKDLVQLPDDLN